MRNFYSNNTLFLESSAGNGDDLTFGFSGGVEY